MSLYLKYRPQQFSDLYGQNHIKITLQKGIELGKVAHAYLFCGPRGTGKTTSARLVAKSLNCTNFNKEKTEPCNECDICREINNGSLVDVLEIDAASNRGIDEIRELRDSVQFAPYNAVNKVYIIDEVHMLTNEAFNALLKTLEEPPKNVYFVLATTEVHKIPDTIISRCQRFDFKKIGDNDILDRIKYISQEEKLNLNDDVLKIVVKKANGGMRDAISLLDQVAASGLTEAEDVSKILGVTPDEVLIELLEDVIEGNVMKSLENVINISNTGYGIKQIHHDMTSVLKDLLESSVFKDDTGAQSRYIFLIESWQSIWNVFKDSAVPEMVLEVFVVKTANHFAGINVNMPTPVGLPEVTVKENTNVSAPAKTVKPVETKPKKEVVVEQTVEVKEAVNPELENILKGEVKLKKKEVKVEAKDDDVSNEFKATIDVSSVGQLDIENYWTKTIGSIATPLIKRTLQPAVIGKDGAGVVVKFNSNFHFKQIDKPEYIKMIEDAFAEHAGGNVKMSFIVDTSLAPDLERKANANKVKPNAFDINPLTGKTETEEMAEDTGVSVEEIADFFS